MQSDNSPEGISHEPLVLTSTFVLDPIVDVQRRNLISASRKTNRALPGLRAACFGQVAQTQLR
jgi:hypothetical protein